MVETIGNQNIINLRDNYTLLPFNRAVSKYNIEEDVDLDIVTTSRKVIDFKLNRLIKSTAIDQTTRFQPIIGGAGCGKTHYYWVLKSREKLKDNPIPFRVIYVSSPPTPYRLMHHIYTCLADELADEYFFLSMINTIFTELNISQDEVDSIDPKFLIAKVLPTFPGIFADCIKALIYLRTNTSSTPQGALALRWLLGESLTEDELRELQINSVLEQDDICLAMIKIISDLSRVVLIFYFDEMESPYRTFGEEAQQKFFEYIKRLYNELRNSIIVTSSLHEIWNKILEFADSATISRMEPELILDHFDESDLKVYYLRAMSRFWASTSMQPPKNAFYPLEASDIEEIYSVCKGNQRECIKNINYKLESVLFGYEYKPYNSKDHYNNIINSIYHKNPESSGDTNKISRYYLSFSQDSANPSAALNDMGRGKYQLPADDVNSLNPNSFNPVDVPANGGELDDSMEEKDPSPGNVLSIVLDILKNLCQSEPSDLTLDFSYNKDGKNKKLGALLKVSGDNLLNGTNNGSNLNPNGIGGGMRNITIGIEIPSIKSFERSAGVAAFYSLKRLDEAISANIITHGIVIIPDKTKGNKYSSVLSQNQAIKEIRIKCDSVYELVNGDQSEKAGLTEVLRDILSGF